MIPNIIHHIVGAKPNKIVTRCLESWKCLMNNGFKIRIWNDEDIIVFINENYPFALDAILHARNHAEVADIARYLIIYHYGGHYFDWDIQLLDKELFLALVQENPLGYLLRDTKDGSLASEAFGAQLKESFLFDLVQDIVNLYKSNERNQLHTLYYSGPFRMRESLKFHQNSSQNILPVKDVFMYDYHEIKEMPIREENRAMIHYWLHSWINPDDSYTNKTQPVANAL